MSGKNHPNLLRILLSAILGLSLGAPAGLQAQTGGDNAVYNSPTAVTSSNAIIDATAFASRSITFCRTIYNILTSATGHTPYPSTGAIIDARGLNNVNSNLTCAAGESPWYNGSGYPNGYANKSSVLLLPAGTITIFYTWQLPNQTKLIGEGAALPGQTAGTQIEAASPFVGLGNAGIPTSMIQFGDTASLTCGGTNGGICFAIGVQDLTLNGANQTSASSAVDGIINLDSQELTYVKRVNLYQITGTGLQVGNSLDPNQPQNSGPYEEINYTAGTSGTPLPVCAQIYSSGPVRGIHGITCRGNSTTTQIAGGALKVDAFANSITDVYIDGFHDGVLIGSQISGSTAPGPGSANVLRNISGSSNVTNLIHICKPSSPTGYCTASTTNPTITDVTIMGVSSLGTLSIEDDMTGANLSDANVAMYALGESMSGGISRFSTSKSVPTWFVGNGAPTSCSTGVVNGSLYSSITKTSSNGPLWVCVAGTWTQVN